VELGVTIDALEFIVVRHQGMREDDSAIETIQSGGIDGID
jgi:hypothetical protein